MTCFMGPAASFRCWLLRAAEDRREAVSQQWRSFQEEQPRRVLNTAGTDYIGK